jgi:hypothetical protein
MEQPPEFLFRVWHDEASGLNKAHQFAPAAACNVQNGKKYVPEEYENQKLEDALRGEFPLPTTPFVFFTESLLAGLQISAFRKAEGRTGITISVVRTTTARTFDGKPIHFHKVTKMREERTRHPVQTLP